MQPPLVMRSQSSGSRADLHSSSQHNVGVNNVDVFPPLVLRASSVSYPTKRTRNDSKTWLGMLPVDDTMSGSHLDVTQHDTVLQSSLAPVIESVKLNDTDGIETKDVTIQQADADIKLERRGTIIGVIATILATFLLSLGAFTAKYLFQFHDAHPPAIVGLRAFFQGAYCLPIICFMNLHKVILKPLQTSPDRYILLLRLVISTTSINIGFRAFAMIDLFDACVIMISGTIMSLLLGYIFLKERFRISDIFLFVISAIAVLLIAEPPWLFPNSTAIAKKKENDQRMLGIVLCLVATFLMSCTFICLRKLKHVPGPILVFWYSMFACVVSLILEAVMGNFDALMTCYEARTVVFISGFAAMVGQVLLALALRHLPAHIVMIVKSIDVVLAMMADAFVFGSSPRLFSIIGSILILSCIVFLSVRAHIQKVVEQKRQLQDSRALRIMAKIIN